MSGYGFRNSATPCLFYNIPQTKPKPRQINASSGGASVLPYISYLSSDYSKICLSFENKRCLVDSDGVIFGLFLSDLKCRALFCVKILRNVDHHIYEFITRTA